MTLLALAVAAAIVAAWAVLLRRYVVPRLAARIPLERAERSLEVGLPPAETLALAEQALESLAGVETLELDEESSRVEATLAGGWKTHGSVVTVSVAAGPNGTTQMRIASRLAAPQLYDWGESRKNVEQVASLVAARA